LTKPPFCSVLSISRNQTTCEWPHDWVTAICAWAATLRRSRFLRRSRKPDWLPPHIELSALYYRVNRPQDGATERKIVDRLRAEALLHEDVGLTSSPHREVFLDHDAGHDVTSFQAPCSSWVVVSQRDKLGMRSGFQEQVS
jgi:hypothetical protein